MLNFKAFMGDKSVLLDDGTEFGSRHGHLLHWLQIQLGVHSRPPHGRMLRRPTKHGG